ncbi:hypothetical protein HNP84_006399 [Thermocatellispora tengchongensis]|uniref:Uncharacterized protein n=1 Tax=Thermocatellispora tengchongensis TaxID=1073253 RepID=A0A840PAH9_9ACTN|nr:hypothetical protein [Thermocatellispora tengchongensis]MBB5136648.1 hypothetical protein [Thermocatellispora tengchongensis]
MTPPSTTQATDAAAAPRLTVSLRETRVLAERNLLLLGVPKGAVPAVRDLVVEAEALGLGGLAFLDAARDLPGWRPPALDEASSPVVVEAHGVPAPYVAPALLDLGMALLRERGGARIEVRDVAVPHLLLALPYAAQPYGGAVTVTLGTGAPRIEVAERHGPPACPHIERTVHEGLEVEASLWWRLYHRSTGALTEDTPLSRRHAGATLDPDAADPDTDLDYLAVTL